MNPRSVGRMGHQGMMARLTGRISTKPTIRPLTAPGHPDLWGRTWITLTLAVLAVGVWQIARGWDAIHRDSWFLGVDLHILLDATRSWMAGHGFYLPYQLAGPYDIWTMNYAYQPPIMYPPTLLLLFVPFTVLPEILWWVIPISVTAWVVWKHQPKPYIWPVLALLLVLPTSLNAFLVGNPVLWFTMAVALGTRYGWPSVLVFLKPTLGPFALIGIWRREWWIGFVGLVGVSLLFAPMWADYLIVLSNTTNRAGALYSVGDWALLCVPVLAWLGAAAGPLVRSDPMGDRLRRRRAVGVRP